MISVIGKNRKGESNSSYTTILFAFSAFIAVSIGLAFFTNVGIGNSRISVAESLTAKSAPNLSVLVDNGLLDAKKLDESATGSVSYSGAIRRYVMTLTGTTAYKVADPRTFERFGFKLTDDGSSWATGTVILKYEILRR